MSLRVAFNATPLLSAVTGIGNYIVELSAALARLHDVEAYSFYRYRWRPGCPEPPRPGSQPKLESLAQRAKPWIPLRSVVHLATKRLGFSRGLRRFRIDLYHEQNYVPLSYDVPVVITIHDLSWIRYPETHPVDRVRWLDKQLPTAIDRAQAILVDSEFVRNEVLTTFGVDPARVHTAHLGVSTGFRPRNPDETRSVLDAMGLRPEGYVLTVGTIEPRKNLGHMLESFARLPSALRERFPLVIAGAKGWQSSDLVEQLRQRGDGQVRFLGHVESSVLPHLYAGAALFAFPSLYEGFGFPPLEAMASGVPVIVSDRASLPEVVGDAGETMDPLDPVATADKLRALLEDAAARHELALRGLARARHFTWAECASVTHSVYLAALGRARAALQPA